MHTPTEDEEANMKTLQKPLQQAKPSNRQTDRQTNHNQTTTNQEDKKYRKGSKASPCAKHWRGGVQACLLNTMCVGAALPNRLESGAERE